MSAPQLPQVALEDDWFHPEIDYPIASIHRTSKDSSVPSQYSRDTGTAASVESTKSSFSFKPASRDDVHCQATRSIVGDHLPVVLVDAPRTQPMASIPVATPDNNFLGFCKGAWNLQNGDQRSMKKCNEADAWSRNAARAKPGHAQYLKCKEPKCEFRSNFVSTNPFLIWNKVFTFEKRGIKLRWPFLAKSHVPQRVVLNSNYSFQCLFCVFMALKDAWTIYNGMDRYLDHISQEHRGMPLGDVIEYKTRCVSTRIADDNELFDINIWPLPGQTARPISRYLSDDLLKQPRAVPARPKSRPGPIDFFGGTAGQLPAVEGGSHIAHKKADDSHHLPASVQDASQATKPSTFHYQPWEDNPAEIWGTLNKDNHSKPRSTALKCPPSTPEELQSPLSGLPSSPSWTPSSAQDLLTPTNQLQLQPGMPQTGPPTDSSLGITNYLDAILELFREASTLLDSVKHSPALSQTPIVRLLSESTKEAPQEILREKNRATLRFGEAFQYGDYIAVCELQRITLRLRSEFLQQLRQAVYERKVADVAQLVDASDEGRYATISALHDLKQRLMQSGCEAYQIPEPRAHPAHQRHGSSEGNFYARRVYVEDSSVAESATSEDPSLHVHFQDDEITTKTTSSSKRRDSILGFLKHARVKSSSLLLVDSKSKSDGIAERRKGSSRREQKMKKSEIDVEEEGIAELDGRPVVGTAK